MCDSRLKLNMFETLVGVSVRSAFCFPTSAFRTASFRSHVKCFSSTTYCSKEAKAEDISFPRRILSGIQPTGSLHLGNYLGAVKHWVHLQNTGEDTYYSIADLHSITVPQDPEKLHRNILEMTASLLACGINPDKSILFQQSKVKQHTELCWVFTSVITMAKVGHQPQLKEKKKTLKDVSMALYLYPILQAADILLYKSTLVPVGEDQVTHLELTQDIAETFNKRFGCTFPIPKAMLTDDGSCRLKSLRSPMKKMSKSDPDKNGCINLSDSPEVIRRKCKAAVTDPISAITYDPEARPGVSNLILIHSHLTGMSTDEICNNVSNMDTGKYKMHMADEIIEVLRPIREEMEKLLSDPSYLTAVLDGGAKRAEKVAEETWQDVCAKIGFVSRDLYSISKKSVEN